MSWISFTVSSISWLSWTVSWMSWIVDDEFDELDKLRMSSISWIS